MVKINYTKALIHLPFAALYGAIYWLFLEKIQPDIVNKIYNCSFCERCANILYDREQIVLAYSAALACVGLAFVKTRGFTGVFKTVGVTYLAFQVYSLITIRSVILGQECTALHRERIFPVVALVILLINMAITSAVWAGICAAPLVFFNIVRSLITADREDSEPLDLGLR